MLKVQKSFHAHDTKEEWVEFDASGQILGRFASHIAFILLGKHKPTYTPSAMQGDVVVVTNVDKIKVTGKKMLQKQYYTHSLYPGHLKEKSLEKLQAQDPSRILEFAVKAMLPKNKQAKHLMKRLRIFAGDKHTHQAQQPKPLVLARRKAI